MSKSRKKKNEEKNWTPFALGIGTYILAMLLCVLMEDAGMNTASSYAPVMRMFVSSILIWLRLLPLVVVVGVLIVIIISLPKKYDKYLNCILICILIISILIFLL